MAHAPAVLPVGDHTVLFVSALLHTERRRLGTRAGTRSLGCYRQAILVLRWLLDGTRITQLAVDNASPPRTAGRGGVHPCGRPRTRHHRPAPPRDPAAAHHLDRRRSACAPCATSASAPGPSAGSPRQPSSSCTSNTAAPPKSVTQRQRPLLGKAQWPSDSTFGKGKPLRFSRYIRLCPYLSSPDTRTHPW
jgi:hypothetical protein